MAFNNASNRNEIARISAAPGDNIHIHVLLILGFYETEQDNKTLSINGSQIQKLLSIIIFA
ncbi:hypothetical protein HUJ04_007245 [Dendroctonus ponderosae]|nr:hypothetical protein HUJ04_007245 [Dendroctonus ponderosae]